MCTVPLFRRVCRESYTKPEALYETLKRRGMDLVTVTDHDSIGSAEVLRRYPDYYSAGAAIWKRWSLTRTNRTCSRA
jgi:hypothetical protein